MFEGQKGIERHLYVTPTFQAMLNGEKEITPNRATFNDSDTSKLLVNPTVQMAYNKQDLTYKEYMCTNSLEGRLFPTGSLKFCRF